MIVGVILSFIGVICLLLALAFVTVSIIFERHTDKTSKTYAVLKTVKHKKNVTLYESTPLTQRWYPSMFIKHLTKGTYIYTVGNKQYKIRRSTIGKPKQLSSTATVVYLKKLPCFSYIDHQLYGLYAFVVLALGAISILFGWMILFP